VVKNRTFGIAARSRGLESLCELLGGEVGVVFREDDSLDLLKRVVKFGKGNEQLRILGGLFEGEVRSADEMLAIAAMPPKEVAVGELVRALGSPLSEVVQILSEVVRSLVFVIGFGSFSKRTLDESSFTKGSKIGPLESSFEKRSKRGWAAGGPDGMGGSQER